MLKILSVLMIATFTCNFALADPVSNEARVAFEARIQAVKQSAVEQIKVLTADIEKLATKEQTALQLQVMEIKKTVEVERLQILLEWAQVEADQEKISEIESALAQLLYPTPEQTLPEISGDKELAPNQVPATETTPR